jgi:hypothetical protein
MKLRHNETGHIFQSEDEFRRAYPNVSFPTVLDQNALNFANVSFVTEIVPPTVNPTQRVDYDGVQLIDGNWTEVWSIHPLYDNPVEQAACDAEYINGLWSDVRSRREMLLTQCDYTMMPDTPITPESKAQFIVYRQQLRDITTQSDPRNIVWPTLPIYQKE